MRQRPARPVGEAMGLVRAVAGDALHQLVVGDGVAIAQHHGRDLGVEHRMRHDVGAMPDDLDVLARGVKHLQHLLVGHQLEERLEVDARRQRVDDDRFLGAGHLHHAQQRVVGGLAQELGIDGDDGVLGQSAAGSREVSGGGNQIHERPMTLGISRSAESAVMSRGSKRIRALHWDRNHSFRPKFLFVADPVRGFAGAGQRHHDQAHANQRQPQELENQQIHGGNLQKHR